MDLAGAGTAIGGAIGGIVSGVASIIGSSKKKKALKKINKNAQRTADKQLAVANWAREQQIQGLDKYRRAGNIAYDSLLNGMGLMSPFNAMAEAQGTAMPEYLADNIGRYGGEEAKQRALHPNASQQEIADRAAIEEQNAPLNEQRNVINAMNKRFGSNIPVPEAKQYTPTTPAVNAFQQGEAQEAQNIAAQQSEANVPWYQRKGGLMPEQFSYRNVFLDPSYNFRFQEGLKSLDRSAAARGLLQSGAQGRALQRYGQNLASQEFGNAFNREQQRLRGDNANRMNAYNMLNNQAQTGINAQNAINSANNAFANNAMQLDQNKNNAYASYKMGKAQQTANQWQAGANMLADVGNNIVSAITPAPTGNAYTGTF